MTDGNHAVEKRPIDDQSSPHASIPSSDVTEYGERVPFQAARPEPLLTRAIPVAGELSRYRVMRRSMTFQRATGGTLRIWIFCSVLRVVRGVRHTVVSATTPASSAARPKEFLF